MERPITDSGEKPPAVRPVLTGIALGFMIVLALVGLADRAGHTNILSSQVAVVKEGYMSLRWERIGLTRLTPERRGKLNHEILLMAQEAGLPAGSEISAWGFGFTGRVPFKITTYDEVGEALDPGERYAMLQLGQAQPKSLASVLVFVGITTLELSCSLHKNRISKGLQGASERIGSLRCIDLISKWSCSWEGEAPDLSELRTGLVNDSDDGSDS